MQIKFWSDPSKYKEGWKNKKSQSRDALNRPQSDNGHSILFSLLRTGHLFSVIIKQKGREEGYFSLVSMCLA